MTSAYDRLGRRYDAWCRSVTEDIPFYVDLALASGGPVLEVGVGSGRVAVPTALAGVRVVGVDSSPVMLDLARERAAPHGAKLELVCADMRDLPELGTFTLVTVPFRAFLHLRDDDERLAVLRALARAAATGRDARVRRLPSRSHRHRRDPRTAGWSASRGSTSGRTGTRRSAGCVLSVRADGVLAEMELWWVDPGDWRALLEQAGFERDQGATAGSTGGRSSPGPRTPSGWRAGLRLDRVAAWTPIPSPSQSTIPIAP